MQSHPTPRPSHTLSSPAFLHLVLLTLGFAWLNQSCTHRPEPAKYGPPCPVIDIHTHTFNLKYLPLRGIIRAKAAGKLPKDVPQDIVKLIESREGADAIARFLLAFTSSDRFDETPQKNPLISGSQGPSPIKLSKLERMRPLETISPQAGLTQNDWQLLAQIGLGLSGNTHRRLTPNSLFRIFADHEILPISHAEGDSESSGKSDPLLFLRTLCMKETKIVKEFRRAYPQVDLLTHHMMDMEMAYKDYYGQDNRWAEPYHPFEIQQRRAAALEDTQDGGLLHFTAYDPFRKDDALPYVQKGIQNGAIGVKFYPPSGYRPTKNKRTARTGNEAMRVQWDNRYRNDSPYKLDRRILKFLKYCKANKIPIFSHSKYGDFEAVPGYGRIMSDPHFWREVLKQKEFSNLYLCFGHAGGPDWWTAQKSAGGNLTSWYFGREVYDLCITYPNVYCELSIFDGIMKDEQRKQLQDNLHDFFTQNEGRYPFHTKVMYGTDWHMLAQNTHYPKFLERATDLFTGKLASYAKYFFSQNALNYLGVHGESDRNWKRLSAEAQDTISTIVERLKTAP